MSHLWTVIEQEMETLIAEREAEKAAKEFVIEQLDAMRKERDDFADDVMRMARTTGYDGPMRGKSDD